MSSDVEYLRNKAAEFKVANVAGPIIENDRFQVCSGSGSPKTHHYGDGGLLKHTVEVIKIGLCNIDLLNLSADIEPRKMFLAALYHDVGKMWDYAKDKNGLWGKTDHCRNIHHISRSVIVWNQQALHLQYDTDFIDEITHAILAHHCERAWGSPVAPNSRLAWLLHLSDNISARMDDVETNDLVKR